ncbi:MAG: hypothetical protein KDE31_11420, partial [Caldilineaceae bacterium]|nr:hypothetical protein [Caldilineaceae bacterium]
MHQIAFSPDGKQLACGGADQSISLWDVETQQELQRLRGHQQAVRAIAFLADGAQLASGSTDGTAKLWDLQRGECLQTLQPPGPYQGMNITGVTGITEAQRGA